VVKVEIAEARSEVMAPLSAASMESYTRAYPYLVKLHMLQASHSLLHMIETPGTNLVACPPSPHPPPRQTVWLPLLCMTTDMLPIMASHCLLELLQGQLYPSNCQCLG